MFLKILEKSNIERADKWADKQIHDLAFWQLTY